MVLQLKTHRNSPRRAARFQPKACVMAAALCVGAAHSWAQAPNIPVAPSPGAWLQTGNPNDAYWVIDNRWGQGWITEGFASNQFEQAVGVHHSPGPNGEVAFRMKWRWPHPPGAGEVKGYPAIVSGRKPGYYSSGNLVDGGPVRLPNGSTLQQAPSGHTPGTFLPMQLPLQNLTAQWSWQHNTPPNGIGQLTFDIWLQSNPKQDAGFMDSSITHEIMIKLGNWGN